MLAPTGTIAFMMDCDTTGVEPDIALVKYKKLVGGGMLKIVNNTVPMALARLGYSEAQRQAILAYVDEAETIEGAPALRDEHLPVFDCAFRPMNGKRSIQWMGHIRMMGAVQPFLSGRDQQDGEPAGRGERRRREAGLRRGLAARAQGARRLPRRQQAHAAAQHGQGRAEGREGREPRRAPRGAA